jgi:hypothetical protein
MTDTLLSDSIDGSLDKIAEALNRIHPNHRQKAKEAAVTIEKVVMQIRRENPRSPAVALGCAFAIYKLAERLRDSEREGADKGTSSLIQLLQ